MIIISMQNMDVYITKLRKLLKDDDNVQIINIHGKGYKLIIPDQTNKQNYPHYISKNLINIR